MAKSDFTAKQWAFIHHYVETLNGTEAARLAKYNGSDDNALAVIAYENLRKLKVREEIDARLDVMSMSKGELVHRLNSHAKASLEQFVEFGEDGEFWINIEKARDAGVLSLAKEMRQTKNVYLDTDGNSETTYKTEVKLHDSQSALDKLARIHGLYINKQEVEHSGGLVVEYVNDWRKD